MKKVRFTIIAALFLALAGCDGGGGDDNNGGGGGGGGDMCGGKCVDGQYCWNGICVNGCLSNGDCAADQYCVDDEFFDQGHCSLKEATGCASNSDCTSPQVCKLGACVTEAAEPPPAGCEWKSDMTDGCEANEVCIQEEEDAEGKPLPGDCYAMPACGEDGSCPKDVTGGVCNEKAAGGKIIASKGRICLMGLCYGDTDCPEKMECMKSFGDLGACMPEGMNPGGCQTDDDCPEGEKCQGAMAGMPGTCMPDMF
ncbi:MAG: hypothetical protein FJ109_17325 [Deltaproteobacteria bacterium]|nr:hypothetical protein [Deltaproteobacteria bacterium]